VVVSVVAPPGTREVESHATRVPVTVQWPAIERVEITARDAATLYAGTAQRLRADAYHADGSLRPEAEVTWSSSNPEVASVDRFGRVVAHRPGTVEIRAEVEATTGSQRHEVRPFTAERLELIPSEAGPIRTGDVVSFEVRAFDGAGNEVSDLPVTWSHAWTAPDTIMEPSAPGGLYGERFVAQTPGWHTVFVRAGPLEASQTLEVTRRNVVQRIVEVGRGPVRHRRTSDFWVYEGVDGRDYAITGTWGTGGFAYFWDVTDPADIVLTDSIQVDARTINDVKVSPDGRYGVLTREGASDRRNGVMIVDLANPAHPTVASTFTEHLTGGVHNVFPTDDYLFALSASEKYVIIDVRDIYNPRYVSEYQHPNARVHDLWVKDGIAYSAQWEAGVVVVDVGNGRWGGSIDNPVYVTSYQVPSGRTHEVWPYVQESTGRLLLFLGDEIIGRPGRALEGGTDRMPYDPDRPDSGRPRSTDGYIHIVDFTDPENPQKIARYHVPDYGAHNSWVKDDILYQAYYEGGLRVVDVSGDLMGNLYPQNREIAVFKPYDPIGFQRNAPMVWATQKHKGHIFISDANSGLWALKLEPLE